VGASQTGWSTTIPQHSGNEAAELSSLIGAIYDAALDPALWNNVLEKSCGFFDCYGGAVDFLQNVNFMQHWGFDRATGKSTWSGSDATPARTAADFANLSFSDTISNFENAKGGSAGDSIYGSGAANRLEGGGGGDNLFGYGGN